MHCLAGVHVNGGWFWTCGAGALYAYTRTGRVNLRDPLTELLSVKWKTATARQQDTHASKVCFRCLLNFGGQESQRDVLDVGRKTTICPDLGNVI
jgi:hypothetical protein